MPSEVPNLAQNAAKQRAAQEAAASGSEPIEARTAFLVFLTKEGQVGSTPNLQQAIEVERAPAAEEVKYACDEISEELTMQKQALVTTQAIVNQQMAARQQAMAAQEASKLGL